MFFFLTVTVAGAGSFPVNTVLYYVLKNNSTDTGVSPEILVVNNINLALKFLYNVISFSICSLIILLVAYGFCHEILSVSPNGGNEFSVS